MTIFGTTLEYICSTINPKYLIMKTTVNLKASKRNCVHSKGERLGWTSIKDSKCKNFGSLLTDSNKEVLNVKPSRKPLLVP